MNALGLRGQKLWQWIVDQKALGRSHTDIAKELNCSLPNVSQLYRTAQLNLGKQKKQALCDELEAQRAEKISNIGIWMSQIVAGFPYSYAYIM